MFKRREEPAQKLDVVPAQIRVTSILGENTSLKGELTGKVKVCLKEKLTWKD